MNRVLCTATRNTAINTGVASNEYNSVRKYVPFFWNNEMYEFVAFWIGWTEGMVFYSKIWLLMETKIKKQQICLKPFDMHWINRETYCFIFNVEETQANIHNPHSYSISNYSGYRIEWYITGTHETENFRCINNKICDNVCIHRM